MSKLISVLTVLLLVMPLVAEPQTPGRIYRLGLLSDEPSSSNPMYFLEPFRQGLRDLGYVEGRNIIIEYRSTATGTDQLSRLASELVRLKVDVIVAIGTPASRAAKEATNVVPIVFARVADPVALGLVSNLRQPGGNVTGVSVVTTELAAKRLELLKEAIPRLERIGVLWNSTFSATAPELSEIRDAARSLRVQLHEIAVRGPEDLEEAVSTMRTNHLGALTLVPNPSLYEHSNRVIELLAKSAVPTMFWRGEWVEIGGLISYGPNYADMYRRAATYVDRILRGAKPADLPVEQPTRFELVINRKTAKTLGITIPPSVLVRADRVLE